MSLTSAEAFTLSQRFRDLLEELGEFRVNEWKYLTDDQRQALEVAEGELLKAANDLNTTAVGLVLDETEVSVDALNESTERAKGAIKTLKTVGKVITIATAAAGLAAAIASKDVRAIGKNAKSLYDAATTNV